MIVLIVGFTTAFHASDHDGPPADAGPIHLEVVDRVVGQGRALSCFATLVLERDLVPAALGDDRAEVHLYGDPGQQRHCHRHVIFYGNSQVRSLGLWTTRTGVWVAPAIQSYTARGGYQYRFIRATATNGYGEEQANWCYVPAR